MKFGCKETSSISVRVDTDVQRWCNWMDAQVLCSSLSVLSSLNVNHLFETLWFVFVLGISFWFRIEVNINGSLRSKVRNTLHDLYCPDVFLATNGVSGHLVTLIKLCMHASNHLIDCNLGLSVGQCVKILATCSGAEWTWWLTVPYPTVNFGFSECQAVSCYYCLIFAIVFFTGSVTLGSFCPSFRCQPNSKHK